MTINKKFLSSRTNPHFFIVKGGGFNMINAESTIVDFKPFPSAKEATKYAKTIGGFAVYASHMEMEKITKLKLI
jgi:hypothetical protein